MNENLTQEQLMLYKTCGEDFGLFVHTFLKKNLTCEIPEFHRKLYEMVPNEKRLVIAAPRGHAKSYIISFFYPLWLALFRHSSDITIISASEALAIEWVRKIRFELENNPLLQMWGDIKSDKWTENHLVLKMDNGVHIRAKGSGGQIRGYRPQTMIIDDLETHESVASEEQRKKLKQWLLKDCLNTLMPEGQFVMIGTILSDISLLSDLLASDNGWRKMKYKAYIHGIQEAGHELWGAMWSHDLLQKRKKEIGTNAFMSEFMNTPMSDENRPITSDLIRNWTDLPQQYSMAIAIDPAYATHDKADWKVAVLVALDQNSNRYLVDYVRTHSGERTFFDAVLNMWKQHKNVISGIGVPNSGVEKAFYNSFLKYCEERRAFPPITAVKNQGGGSASGIKNKKHRIIATLQPLFEQGKYYIHANHLEARDELLTIGASRWDDIVDAMTYAEQVLQPSYYDIVYNYSDDDENYVKPKQHELGECYGI